MSNGHGGCRAGAGRPKGTTKRAKLKSRLSKEQLDEVEAVVRAINGNSEMFDGDAYAFLAAIYKNTRLPMMMRLGAAQIAIAYERPKLTKVQVSEPVDQEQAMIDELIAIIEASHREPVSEPN